MCFTEQKNGLFINENTKWAFEIKNKIKCCVFFEKKNAIYLL